MRTLRALLFWLTSSSLLLTALLVIAAPSVADSNSVQIFNIEASTVTPKQITVGEPVIVRCNVKNVSGQVAAAHIGRGGTDWYTLTLRDASGRLIPFPLDNRFKSPSGPYWTMNSYFQNESASDEYILINTSEITQKPGNYTLIVHVSLQYALITDAEVGSPGALTRAAGLTQIQDISLPIIVTSADPTRLRAVTEALRKAASGPISDRLKLVYMDALFSMPEAQAAPVWTDLATKPGMNTDLVANELERLHSKSSVDILVKMLDTPNLECTPISDRINRIYNAGTPALREHIKVLAEQHGFVMPDVAGVPMVMKAPAPDSGGILF